MHSALLYSTNTNKTYILPQIAAELTKINRLLTQIDTGNTQKYSTFNTLPTKTTTNLLFVPSYKVFLSPPKIYSDISPNSPVPSPGPLQPQVLHIQRQSVAPHCCSLEPSLRTALPHIASLLNKAFSISYAWLTAKVGRAESVLSGRLWIWQDL